MSKILAGKAGSIWVVFGMDIGGGEGEICGFGAIIAFPR